MTCKLVITDEARENLTAVRNPVIREQLIKRIDVLADNLESGKHLRGILTGYRSLWASRNRYRFIYRFIKEEERVVIIAIGLRKSKDFGEVYKSLRRLIKSNKGLDR